ncbi:MAG: hypothetical protein HOP11_14375 [Saprospiraceae bacterium]|nr:hypothetical protein [Saprospiraceae bacterium]
MPVTVTVTPTPPIQVIAALIVATTIQITPIPPIEFVEKKYQPETAIDVAKKVRNNYTAGSIINGGKCVVLGSDGKVYHCDITNPVHYYSYIGVAENAALTNEEVKVVSFGEADLDGPFTNGQAYYIGADGFPFHAPPVIGLCKQIGVGRGGVLMLGDYTEFIII